MSARLPNNSPHSLHVSSIRLTHSSSCSAAGNVLVDDMGETRFSSLCLTPKPKIVLIGERDVLGWRIVITSASAAADSVFNPPAPTFPLEPLETTSFLPSFLPSYSFNKKKKKKKIFQGFKYSAFNVHNRTEWLQWFHWKYRGGGVKPPPLPYLHPLRLLLLLALCLSYLMLVVSDNTR